LTAARQRRAARGLVIIVMAAGLIARAAPAAAVGLEGDAAAACRVGAGIGMGWDQVAGVGRDAYPFLEPYVHGDWRFIHGLAVGGGLSLRRDLANYDFALGRWRRGATAVDAQIAFGYDGPRFHLSAGPALAGDNRGGDHFQLGLLPLGVLRMRVGHQDRWNAGVRLLQAVPGAATGGAIALRIDLAPPPIAGHRPRAGLYASIAEATVGVSASDELGFTGLGFTRVGPRVRALHLACFVGTDVGHLLRAELTCAAGVVF
jgi:hypothetical protein